MPANDQALPDVDGEDYEGDKVKIEKEAESVPCPKKNTRKF